MHHKLYYKSRKMNEKSLQMHTNIKQFSIKTIICTLHEIHNLKIIKIYRL